MTEQQREDDLLAELLHLPEGVAPPEAATRDTADVDAMPVLSRQEELALLEEAHQVGTPTLTPTTEDEGGPSSFAADIIGLVRRHPLPAVLAGAGLMLLLARRRARS